MASAIERKANLLYQRSLEFPMNLASRACRFLHKREERKGGNQGMGCLGKRSRISEDLLEGLGRLVEIDFSGQCLDDEVQPSRIVVPINMRINPRPGPKPFLGGAPKPN